jgi:5-methyltetrahydropteroyltriglutamate--homocysteine methyltransferase
MVIPTEPIGCIPRPKPLVEAVAKNGGNLDDPALEPLIEAAIRDTIARFEATGSPVVTDGEQRRYHDFCERCLHDLFDVAANGFLIPAGAGRKMPQLREGPLRFKKHADDDLEIALRYAKARVKQTVISPSALSLLYPVDGIAGYTREQFLDDLLAEHVDDVRRCLAKGAHSIQIDFTEASLAIELDPTGALLASFLDLNNIALARFTCKERRQLGVHHCPGRMPCTRRGIDDADLLPSLLQLNVTNFYVSLAGEKDRERILKALRDHLKPDQRVFIGVVSPLDPRLETAEEIRDRILEAAHFIPPGQLGTTDDCGFCSNDDDAAPTRDIAFAKIGARVRGTELAARLLRAS